MDCSTTGFPVHHHQSLHKLMSIESVMPSNHLIHCYPLLPWPSIFPSIRVFSKESVLRIRWPKYWSFNFSISPFDGYSGLTSFRIDWLDFPVSKGLLIVFNTTVQKHQFFSTQLSLWPMIFMIFKIMASDPITSWQINEETMETVTGSIFLGSKITADGDCSYEIKRHFLLGRKTMTNLDSILKDTLLC